MIRILQSARRLRSSLRYASNEIAGGSDKLYLHVGPSGDAWTGSTMFAAKHLQPDYVKSVKLPDQADASIVEEIVEQIEANSSLAKEIYDTGKLPSHLLDKLSAVIPKDEDGR